MWIWRQNLFGETEHFLWWDCEKLEFDDRIYYCIMSGTPLCYRRGFTFWFLNSSARRIRHIDWYWSKWLISIEFLNTYKVTRSNTIYYRLIVYYGSREYQASLRMHEIFRNEELRSILGGDIRPEFRRTFEYSDLVFLLSTKPSRTHISEESHVGV